MILFDISISLVQLVKFYLSFSFVCLLPITKSVNKEYHMHAELACWQTRYTAHDNQTRCTSTYETSTADLVTRTHILPKRQRRKER